MESMEPQCAKCSIIRCRTLEKDKKLPVFCPTKNYPDIIEETVQKHRTDPEAKAINQAWVDLMKTVGPDRYSWTRLQEVI